MRFFPHSKALVLLTVLGLIAIFASSPTVIPSWVGVIAAIVTLTSFVTLIVGIIAGIFATFQRTTHQEAQR
ncbi:hypothetical protein [Leifsonia sp. TF02-11]|uniref:hypothetical protein n=1 Tax=Leifsonia sp. TF02-11 TaxID=2815212 RepID=UPI001AA15275|nr:hypothetical protein [Leifsonia sp. TF02-11]MBO1741614.1 hypothetical protein [Leifsonia sp. TF02-11]